MTNDRIYKQKCKNLLSMIIVFVCLLIAGFVTAEDTALLSEAEIMQMLDDYKSASGSFERDKLEKKLQGIIDRSFNLAKKNKNTHNYQEAIYYYKLYTKIIEEVFGENRTTAISFHNLAHLYETIGEYAHALPLYHRSLTINEKILGPVHSDTAISLNSLAWIYRVMDDYELALPLYQRALAIREETLGPMDRYTAVSLSGLAGLYVDMGDYIAALPLYQRSLAINEKVLGPLHNETATILNNIALLYEIIGDYERALPLYKRALAIRENILGPMHTETASVLNNLAALYQAMGDYNSALPLLQRASAITETVLGPMHTVTASSLNNLAHLYEVMGNYSAALPLYQRALAIREKVMGPTHTATATNLNNLAGLYNSMGNYDAALPLYQRSLAIRENVLGPMHAETATVLNNLALLYKTMGDYSEALQLSQRSLAIHQKMLGKEHPFTATSLDNLAVLNNLMGKYTEALPLYQQALAIREKVLGPMHVDTATSLSNLAGRYQLTGDYTQAQELSQRALIIYETVLGQSHPSTSKSLNNLALLFSKQDQDVIAIALAKRAVNGLQATRTNISSLSSELQKTFLEKHENYYRNLADWLIDAGRLSEAQQVLAMLKEQEYFDFILRDLKEDPRQTKAYYTPIEKSWISKYSQVSARLSELNGLLKEMNQKEKTQVLTEQEQNKLKEWNQELKMATNEFKNVLNELQTAFVDEEGKSNTDFAEVSKEYLRSTQEMLSGLGHGAVLLQYIATDDTVHILLTTTDNLLARKYEISSKDLNKAIQDYRAILQNPAHSPYEQGLALYDVLIKPVEEDLKQAGAKTLMLSLDGVLRYLPIAALYDGKQYMAQKYRLVMHTDVARDTLQQKPVSNWTLAGLGLSQQVGEMSPLFSVDEELEGIVIRDSDDRDGVIPGVIYLNNEFDKERFITILGEDFRVIHIASHFVWRPGNGYNSYLVLGNGKRLTLAMIKDEDFNFDGLDLITLSACNTAIGSSRAGGQEVEGFGTLVQKKGAKAVIATLWEVADKSTSLFMQSLYAKKVESPELTKAEVLQQVQQEFISGQISDTSKSGGSRGIELERSSESGGFSSEHAYAHPYYWAPFIMMGNWL